MQIHAKKLDEKYQSLEEHTEWVIEEAFKQIDEKSLTKVALASGWSEEKIKDLIFFCSYFHDIGKATFEFQNTIQHGSKSYHAMYSASTLEAIIDFEFSEDDIYINLLLIVVLTHHSLMPYIANTSKFNYLKEAQSFFENYQNIYKKNFQKQCNYSFDFKISDDIKFEIENIENDLKQIKQNHKLRTLYTYVSGILNIADWLASARFSQTTPLTTFISKPAKQNFVARLTFDNLRDFQENLSDLNQSALVEIPTGEGKTEGSLLWAIKNIYNENSKIIYTLPTQTTSNKLYDRVQNYFKKQECSLIHSNAKLFLEKEYEKDNGIVDEIFQSDFLVSKSFNKPITVSTIDSLLKYFINIGRFNIATKNFLNSVIIIDEIHSYDLKLMGFLKRFLELCAEYEIRVCLMSASIPHKIKKLLNIENYPVITQNDLFKKKANEITKKNSCLDEDLDFILEKFEECKNILIIRNTVASATETFKNIKKQFSLNNEEIIIYHSTFKKIDKQKKEKLIFEKLDSNKPFILVATQIVEVSLDIDFDVMFTDNAPIDSLIQRFGRVNRKKDKNKKGEIFIYRYEKAYPYTNTYLLDLTFEVIQNGYFELGEYVQWLNTVYNTLFEKDISIKNEITRLFDEAYEKYDMTLQKLHGIEQSSDNYDLRDITIQKNDYLLYDDYMENNRTYDYTISLPIYMEKYIYNSSDDIKYQILNLKYSYEEGIEVNATDDIFIELGE